MAHLITGYAGIEHIKSADQGSYNAAFFGSGQNVLDIGNQLKANIISNSTVRVLDGDILMKGRHIRVEGFEDVTIETGSAGTSRIDLIVMTYNRNTGTGIESAYLEVIKGTPTSGTPAEPNYINGDILGGAEKNQMPLYAVRINGVALANISKKFDTILTYEDLAKLYADQFQTTVDNYIKSLSILDTMSAVNSNTEANHLAGALALKEFYKGIVTDGTIKAKNATNATNATTATTANAVAWGNVTGKPSTYAPSSHNHDDRYFTEAEINTKLNGLLTVVEYSGKTDADGYFTKNISKSGYTPLGIVGVDMSPFDMTNPCQFYISGTTAHVGTMPMESNVTVKIYVLYRKNS